MVDILMRNKVLIDGRTLPGWGLSVNWADSPEPKYEEVPNIYDAFTRYVEVNGEGEGTLEVSFLANISDVNDPVELFDALGMKSTYSYYDTTEEKMVHSSDHYDFSDNMTLVRPQIPIEGRQINQDTTISLDDGTAEAEAIAFRVKAMGDVLDLVRFMGLDVSDGDTDVTVSLYTEDSNEPDSIIAGSSSTVTVSGDTLSWYSVSDLSVESLTVGDYYWVVLQNPSADVVNIGAYASSSASFMDVMQYDGADWTQVAGSENPTVILQFYNSAGGHKVELYSYNQSLDKYVLWTLDKAKVTCTGIEKEAQAAMKVSLSVYSQNISSTLSV